MSDLASTQQNEIYGFYRQLKSENHLACATHSLTLTLSTPFPFWHSEQPVEEDSPSNVHQEVNPDDSKVSPSDPVSVIHAI